MNYFEVLPDAVVWRGDGETLMVQAWGPHGLRVRARRGGEVLDADFALLPSTVTSAEITVDDTTARITNGRTTAVLRASAGYSEQLEYHTVGCTVEFQDRAGRTLLRELDRGGSLNLVARAFRPHLGGDFEITASFESDRNERLSGMGQYQQDLLDVKGTTLELAHRNSQASVPFVVSTAGYGMLWHNPAIGRATFAANRTEWFATSSKQLDYWVTAGDSPAEISQAYADATGHAPVMPEYGLGYWQCKLRYWNQEQLLEVAREHHRRGLPLDVIVADFFHWPHMGDYRFEEEFWPDPAAMVAELTEMGTELMVSVWPQVATDSENYAEFKQRNMLVTTERGMDVHMAFGGPSAFLDVTNPRARERLWELCRRNYHDFGVKLFWLDEAEPEYGIYDFDNYRYHAGPNAQIGNLYPQHYARAFYEGQVAAGQDDVVNLLRCAWAGSQRYGALVWSGDIHSTYTDLRRQIVAGIHMGMAGIPWFTTDIGGFHHGLVGDPDFHDLLVRWFQFGAFCPVMRLHGDRFPYEDVVSSSGEPRLRSGGPNELWSFGEEVYEILSRYVHLRERLRPYTRAAMNEAQEAGLPVMRGLFFEFPDDPECWVAADQFLFGRDLLVAPVVEPHATSRKVYLPQGASWTRMDSGGTHEGGQWIDAEAPLDTIPVFVRSDASSGVGDLLR
ncbi:MAG TPA: glycoside hydrolase family 31 protein [Arachnia sp.]|nr:glycoside hydrolase family 31 protein [Arachnia sp.]HMT85290.1 glycoside hydrolase family 31 protein [Arachnia sp.]